MPWQLQVAMVVILGFTVVHYTFVAIWAVLAWRAAGARNVTDDVLAVQRLQDAPGRLGVSVIMPAYNEAVGIVAAVSTMLTQDYPHLEVIVVNDGSTDDTMGRLHEAFSLVEVTDVDAAHPIATDPILATYRSTVDDRILVIDKQAGGTKAAGSNAGLNAARLPWVVVMDADEVAEPDVIALCMDAVLRSDVPVIAAGATLLPSNDCTLDVTGAVVTSRVSSNYWVGCQTVEYLQAFCVARAGLDHMNAMVFVSGGFGLFLRDAVLDVGGYTPGHFGEDLELCIRLQRHHRDRGLPYRILHVPEALVWTEFPASRQVLGRQRRRWQWGLAQVMGDHRDIRHGAYGRFGAVGFGTLRLLEWRGAAVEVMSWMVLALVTLGGWLDVAAMLVLLGCIQVLNLLSLGVAMTIVRRRLRVFRSRRDVALLLLWGVLGSVGFRQLTLWWRVRATLSRSREWGQMTRTGVAGTSLAGAR